MADIQDLMEIIDVMDIGDEMDKDFKLCVNVFYINILEEPEEFEEEIPLVKTLVDLVDKHDTWNDDMSRIARNIAMMKGDEGR
jgi:hypothetical protein